MKEQDYKSEIIALKLALHMCCLDILIDAAGGNVTDDDLFEAEVTELETDYLKDAREFINEQAQKAAEAAN